MEEFSNDSKHRMPVRAATRILLKTARPAQHSSQLWGISSSGCAQRRCRSYQCDGVMPAGSASSPMALDLDAVPCDVWATVHRLIELGLIGVRPGAGQRTERIHA